jgi:hypothetical protein
VGIGSGSGQVDVTVPLQALSVPEPGLAAFTIDVHYDPAVLDATACEADPDGVFGFAFCNPDFDDDLTPPDTVRLAGIDAMGVPGDPLLANLTFHCRSEGTSDLDVVVGQFTDRNGVEFPVVEQDGSITCTIPTPTPTTPTFLGPAPASAPTPPATPVTASPRGSGFSFVTRRPMDSPDPRSMAPESLLRATLPRANSSPRPGESPAISPGSVRLPPLVRPPLGHFAVSLDKRPARSHTRL